MVWWKFNSRKVFILPAYSISYLKLSGTGYGEMSMVYAAIPFLNVIFTYGIETAYFRFASKDRI